MRTGFSLIEVVIVIAILAVLIVIFLPIGLDFYRIYVVNNTEDQVIGFLKQARVDAINQKNESDFGFYHNSSQIILFEGSSYATRNPDYDLIYSVPNNINITGLQEVVFAKNSGLPSQTGTITITLDSRIKEITINSEGLISY